MGILSFFVPLIQFQLGVPAHIWREQQWWSSGIGLFKDWGIIVMVAILLSTMHSFFSGLLVKKLSSVMKLLGKCLGVVLFYFINDGWYQCSTTFDDCCPNVLRRAAHVRARSL